MSSISSMLSPQQQTSPQATKSSSSSSPEEPTKVMIDPAAALAATTPGNTSGNNNSNNANISDDTDKASQRERKRSKVSRACDECRRKKIRCDATFTQHSNTLEKACTSCSKNNYICSFDRVPLKRGPTKGFSKGESTTAMSATTVLPQTTPIQPSTSRNPSFGTAQQSHSLSHITLPPLTSITATFPKPQNQQQQQQQPGSPQQPALSEKLLETQVANPSNPNGIIPQSQFWKVPHEAPFDRRGSVGSINSSISDSRFSFGDQNPQFSLRPTRFPESGLVSDSEDDLRSAGSSRNSIDLRSRSNSQSLPGGPASPALSLNSVAKSQYSFSQKAPSMSIPQINTNHLIESYYRFIHPNMPILPLNNQSLVNILSKPPPLAQNEFDELNRFIIQNFYSSLDLLISIVTRQRSPSVSTLNLSPNLMLNNAQFIESLNILFTGLSKIFNKVVNQFDQFQQQIMVLFLSTLVILSYSVVLLGDQADVMIINSSVMLFSRVKIYKLFWVNVFQQSTINDNYDDYHYMLRRLWMSLNTLFSIHTISHGLPRSTVMDLNLKQIDEVFPVFPGVDKMKDVLKLGWIFSNICGYRDFSGLNNLSTNVADTFLNEYLRKGHKFTTATELFGSVDSDGSLSIQFFESILNKFELISFLHEVTHHVTTQEPSKRNIYDEDLLYDYQSKLSRIIKKLLTSQTRLFSTIDNYTNCIDTTSTALLVSPLLPLIFKQSIKNLNILKILINSLQLNESIVTRLSKLLNDLIKLTNTLSLIKPFIDNELNNHLNFKFPSPYVDFWDNVDGNNSVHKVDGTQIQEKWYGLMIDLLKFYKIEDYEGWF